MKVAIYSRVIETDQHADAQQLFDELAAQGDPRMSGHGGVFEAEPYAVPALRRFYERFMAGERLKANWVNETDFEMAPAK